MCSLADYYLAQTEPSEYSFADLQKDKKTVVGRCQESGSTPKPGPNEARRAPDLYPHGDEKSAVGHRYINFPYTAQIPRLPKLGIQAGNPLPRPVTLAEIKANKLFADFTSSSAGRLSVVPLTPAPIRLSDFLLKVPQGHSPRCRAFSARDASVGAFTV